MAKVTRKVQDAMRIVLDDAVCMLNPKTGVECWFMSDEVEVMKRLGWQIVALPYPLTVKWE